MTKINTAKAKRALLCIAMAIVMFLTGTINVSAAPYSGIYARSGNWVERTGFLGLGGVDAYNWAATYVMSGVYYQQKLTKTVHWDNYNNSAGTAQSITLGIERGVGVGKAIATTTTTEVAGKTTLKKSEEVSVRLGGSITNSRYYNATINTSSAYTIDTRSRNGYYAIYHAVNYDMYDITIEKNFESFSSGKLIRFATKDDYEFLRYSSKNTF